MLEASLFYLLHGLAVLPFNAMRATAQSSCFGFACRYGGRVWEGVAMASEASVNFVNIRLQVDAMRAIREH